MPLALTCVTGAWPDPVIPAVTTAPGFGAGSIGFAGALTVAVG